MPIFIVLHNKWSAECIILLVMVMFITIPLSGSTEVKHKLYGSVLIIGGGLAFPGAAAMLQARLELQLPGLVNRAAQTVEVFSNPRVS